MKYLKFSLDHQLSWCQFLFFRPKLLYPPEQALYVVIFQPSSYPQHGLEGITFFLIAERLHKEVLSCSINFKYIICCINLFLSWQPSDKLISVFVISIMSVNVVIYSFWVTLRVIVKLQINIFINWHVDLMEQRWIHSNNISDMCCIINSNYIKPEFIIWFHTSASLYIIIFIRFVLEWIW